MAYTINKYNNDVLSVIEDGTIDQTTDLKLVGKNYAGYGEIQNENFVFLLENFAGGNEPPRKLTGQIWFDTGTSKLKFYDGTKWRTTGGAEVSTSTPTGLAEGDFWWDTSNEQLYAYNGTEFILVGPQDAGDGVTQMQSRTIRDTLGNTRSIITSVVNDEVITVISANDFTIDSSDSENAIAGFDRIHKGVTLRNTLNSQGSVSNQDTYFWGTASNADKLGGVSAANFVQAGEANFTTLTEFADIGLAVGDSNDLRVFIESDNQAVVSNTTGNIITFRVKPTAGDIQNVVRMKPGEVIPGLASDGVSTQTVNLGNTDHGFNNIHATNIYGTSEKASTLVVGGANRSGSTASTANTVAVRDASGDLYANLFQGTATSARYADLAEKYSTCCELKPGTAVAVCTDEDHEVGPAKSSDICIGVISTDPAYMMNSDAEGQYVGLKGRLPVRVKGPVKKGQAVYAWEDGICGTIQTNALVGVALESNDAEDEKLVECVLKT